MSNSSVMKNWKDRVRASTVARDTVGMTAGSGARILLQAVYFILIARSLGPGQYGAFIGVVSLIAVLTPFSMWGTEGLLVRNVARRKEAFAESWGNALWMAGVSGSILLIIAMLISRFALSNRASIVLVFLVGLSDLILTALVDLSGKVFLAFDLIGRTSQIAVLLTAVRAVCALLMFLLVPHPKAISWAVLYLCSTAFCAVYATTIVLRRFGSPRLGLASLKADVLEGFYFSLGLSSQNIYNNIDKVMLVRLATLEATGIYSTAYRVIDLALQPVSSLLYSTYTKFFQHGLHGIHGSVKYAKRLLPFGLGYAALVGVALFLIAPGVPVIIGRNFYGADDALRWLSPLIFIRTGHYFLANSLTGADFQGLRSGIQLGVAVFNVAINLLLISAYSWRGAAWGSLASDGLLFVSLLFAVQVLRSRAKSDKFAQQVHSQRVPI